MRPMICFALVLAACASPQMPGDEIGAFNVFVPTPPSDGHEVFAGGAHHPIPKQCASGCDVAPAAIAEGISSQELEDAVRVFAAMPARMESVALDTLLFHAAATRDYLARGTGPLSAVHRARLERELARDHALIEFRLVDEHGVTRAWLEERAVPLGVKQHLDFAHERLPGLVASGTVVRVGTEHLWTRV